MPHRARVHQVDAVTVIDRSFAGGRGPEDDAARIRVISDRFGVKAWAASLSSDHYQ